MRFEDVLKYMREGKKVKRPCMFYPIFLDKEQEIFFAKWDDGYEQMYWIEYSDIFAEDWEIIEKDEKQ